MDEEAEVIAEDLTPDLGGEEIAVEDPPELSPTEQKAWDQGWRPQDQFDGPEENWKTASEYVIFGEVQDQIRDIRNDFRRKEGEFDTRIANLNKLHTKQQEQTVAALRVRQREAVETGDTEAYDGLQTQIDNHETVEEAAPQVIKDPLIVQWEERNTWINDVDSEKAQQANAFLTVASQRPNATLESALKYVDDQMDKLYPPATNSRRDQPTMTEQGARTNKRNGKALTMADLTQDESIQWKQFGQSMFKDEKEFLKAVADARKQ